MSISFQKQVTKQEIPLFSFSRNNVQKAMVSCAVGATIGDAIGSPFENKKPEEIQRIWSKSNNTINDHLCHLGLIYTDDTQMAISIIESYLV